MEYRAIGGNTDHDEWVRMIHAALVGGVHRLGTDRIDTDPEDAGWTSSAPDASARRRG